MKVMYCTKVIYPTDDVTCRSGLEETKTTRLRSVFSSYRLVDPPSGKNKDEGVFDLNVENPLFVPKMRRKEVAVEIFAVH